MDLCHLPELVLHKILESIDPFCIPKMMRTNKFMNREIFENRHRMRKATMDVRIDGGVRMGCVRLTVRVNEGRRFALEIREMVGTDGRSAEEEEEVDVLSSINFLDEEEEDEDSFIASLLQDVEKHNNRKRQPSGDITLAVRTRKSLDDKTFEVLERVLEVANVGILDLIYVTDERIRRLASLLTVYKTFIRKLMFRPHNPSHQSSSLFELVSSLRGTEAITITTAVENLSPDLFKIPQMREATKEVVLGVSPFTDADLLSLAAKRIQSFSQCEISPKCLHQLIQEWLSYKRQIGKDEFDGITVSESSKEFSIEEAFKGIGYHTIIIEERDVVEYWIQRDDRQNLVVKFADRGFVMFTK